MEVKLDGEAVAALASAAIFESMSEEQRESVLRQAVQVLLTPEKDHRMVAYGKSPLQRAFESAIQAAAYKAVQEKMADDPELKAAINNLIHPVVLGAIKEGSSQYNDTLSEAVGKAFGQWFAEQARGA